MNPFAKPTTQEVNSAVREALAANVQVDSIIEDAQIPPEVLESAEAVERAEYVKLSKLVADDFPFDESQLAAIEGMIQEQYAALTGAAGTGKTTSTKKLVDRLMETTDMRAVDMRGYWKTDAESAADAEDTYDSEAEWIPAVVMGAFTGRATQMIKKNFPRDWHGNIMTIHRMLGFYPERYEAYDEERQEWGWKMRFVPTYTAEFQMPWDVYILDEAGMIGVDLWHQFLAAVKPGARIFMVGDINQLPPVHGKSVFGFAMAKWPSWELTHVHRQQGKDNPIVDNAWRILHGKMPQTGGRFQMVELKGDAQLCSRKIRAMLPKLQEAGIYEPIRDTVITPINGEEGARGFALGQLPLNRELALIFNPASEHPRYIIDGGRERKQLAVGDKVMATKNDWEAGITNGMTGVITQIAEHAGYSGDRRLFGRVEDVNAYLAETGEEEHREINLDLNDLNDSFDAIDAGLKAKKEKRERGPSSHIITVRFGDEEHGLEIAFQSLSEVGSLMTAYVVTCHKMQGGESPTIVIICHDAHKSMLYREWLYTAVTRASEKCILLFTPTALRTALSKQSIKGATLQEKVRAFNAAMDPKGLLGAAIKVNIPESTSTANRVMERKDIVKAGDRYVASEAEKKGGLAELMAKARKLEGETIREAPKVEPKPTVTHVHIHVHTELTGKSSGPVVVDDPEPRVVNGGDLKPVKPVDPRLRAAINDIERLSRPKIVQPFMALPTPSREFKQYGEPVIGRFSSDPSWKPSREGIPQHGAVKAMFELSLVSEQSKRLLPAPEPKPEPVKPMNPWASKLGVK